MAAPTPPKPPKGPNPKPSGGSGKSAADGLRDRATSGGGAARRDTRGTDETKGVKERTADAGEAVSRGVERAGRGTEVTARGVKRAAGATEKAAKVGEASGKAMQTGGKAVDNASKPVTKAGMAKMKGGASASGTGVGAVAGVPMMVAGGVTAAIGGSGQAVGKAGTAAGHVTEKTSKTAGKGAKGAKKGAEKVEKAGAKTKEAGAKGKNAAQNLRKEALKGKKAERAYDKFDPTKKAAKVIDEAGGGKVAQNTLKAGEFGARNAGRAVGAVIGALGAGTTTGVGAKVGAKVGTWTFKVAMTVIPIVLLLFLALILAVTAGDTQGGGMPMAEPDEDGVEHMPTDWLEIYQELSYGYGVPWPIVAAVGEITSKHGTVDPYTNEELNGSFPFPSDWPIGPSGGESGGVGPFLLSEWTVDNHLDGGDPNDAEAALFAIVEALYEQANEMSDGGLCDLLIDRREEDPNLTIPESCEQRAEDDGMADESAAGANLTLSSTDAIVARAVLASADDTDDEDGDDGDDEQRDSGGEEMVRWGAMSKEMMDDEEWGEHLTLWFDVLVATPLIELTGNELCRADPNRLTVEQTIEVAFRCEADTAGDLHVGTVETDTRHSIFNDDQALRLLDQDEALKTLIDEAVAVSYLYNQHGRKVECDTHGNQGGLFPISSVIKGIDTNDDGVNDDIEVVRDRCDNQEAAKMVAEMVIERETSSMGSRDGSNYEKVAHGWRRNGLAASIGSDNTFLTSGKEHQGEWGAGVNESACAMALGLFLQDADADALNLGEEWEERYRDGMTSGEFDAAIGGLAGWDSWDRVLADCQPEYPEVDGVYGPDLNWSLMVRDVAGDINFTYTRPRNFVSFHSQAHMGASITPEWGVTAAFERLSDRPLENVIPAWQPVGNIDVAGEIMAHALSYIGEDCGALSGAGVTLVGGDGTDTSSDRFERAKAAAEALYQAGFRGDTLIKMTAIGGPESFGWVPDTENPYSSAVGVWQTMWSVHESKMNARGWTYEDMKDLQINAHATMVVFQEAVAMYGYEPTPRYPRGAYTPWEVTAPGYQLETWSGEWWDIANAAVEEQIGSRIDDPAPEDVAIPDGSATESGPGSFNCGGTAMGAYLVGDGEFYCPVAGGPGSVGFMDDWGFSRGGGSRTHQGLDMFGDIGTPLVAVHGGVVGRLTREDEGLGGRSFRMTTDDAEDTYWYYTHLHEVDAGVETGMRIEAGTIVGQLGNSGNARYTPPHVHLERHPGGQGNPQPLYDIMMGLCEENFGYGGY
jgi:hypothetical protein